jgi:methionyl aminopeptidase
MYAMGFTETKLIKNENEIEIMRTGGKLLGNILLEIKNATKPGVDVFDLEKLFISLCEKNAVTPTCKGYTTYGLPPFPTGLCVSINSQAVHCIPKKGVILQDTDLITVDTVIEYKGFNTDASFALAMPNASDDKKDLAHASETAMYAAIEKVSEGVRIGVISDKLYKSARATGFNVLMDYAGHGIGRDMHEWPEVPCYGDKHEGPKLKAGMTICIEALLCSGESDVDNVTAWETKMHDGGNFCQFEHTILVKNSGFEILTSA